LVKDYFLVCLPNFWQKFCWTSNTSRKPPRFAVSVV